MEEIIKVPTRLDYGFGAPILEDNQFKISPSGAKNFFAWSHLWFEKQFLEQNKFEGSTASVRGTCLHWLAQQYATNGVISDDDMKEMDQYIKNNEDLPDVDVSEIEYSYTDMWDLLQQWIDENPLSSTEQYVTKQLSEHVVLSGQYDYARPDVMRGGVIVGDYKSTGNKSMPSSVSYDHRFQAQIYAYALRESGENVTSIEITYIKAYVPGEVSAKTGKVGKAYPAEVKSYTEPYTDEDHEKIDSQMKLMAETMEYFFANPELAYLLFKDYRLKGTKFDVSKYQSNIEEEF